MLVPVCDIGILVPGIILATKLFSIDVQPTISEDETAVVAMSIGNGGIKLGDDVTSVIGMVLKASGGPEYGFMSCFFLCYFMIGICLYIYIYIYMKMV